MHVGIAGKPSHSTLERIILAVFVVLFVANFALHDSRGLAGHSDTFHYLIPAANLAEGHGYTYFGTPELIFPPGYGLAALPLHLAGFELVQAGVIANVAFLLLTCLFAYLMCRFYVSRTFALLAPLFLVSNAFIMGVTAVGASTVAYMAAISGAGYFVLRFIRQPRRNPHNLIVASAFGGWAMLTRPEGMGIAAALLGFLILDLAIRQPSPRLSLKFAGQLALYVFVYVAPLAAVYAPYAGFLSRHVGEFTLTTKAASNVVDGQVAMQEGEDNEFLRRDLYLLSIQTEAEAPTLGYDLRVAEVETSLREDIPRFLKNLAAYAKYLIGENIAVLAAVVLFVAACAWRDGFRKPPIRLDRVSDLWEPIGFCLFMLSPVIPMAYFVSGSRFFTPHSAFVIIGAVVLLGWIFAGRPAAAQKADWRVLTFSVALPLILLDGYWNISIWRRASEIYPLQRASIALSALAAERPVNVISLRRPAVAMYYANGRRAPFAAKSACAAPRSSPDDIIDYMQTKGLRYLLLDRTYMPTRPGVSPLWTCPPDSCPPALRLVLEERGVYRIFELSPMVASLPASSATLSPAAASRGNIFTVPFEGKDCR